MPKLSKSVWRPERLEIGELALWDENSRLPDHSQGGNDKDLIQALLTKYKLADLASEIVRDLDLPQIERLVILQKGKKYIVLEGNRRVAAYKCLANPLLIDDQSIRRKFEVLSKDSPISPTFKLDTMVTSRRSEGMRLIERKHYRGNNEMNWGEFERHNHIRRTRTPTTILSSSEAKSIFRANLARMVQRTNLPDEMKNKILGQGFVTTFYRVVDSDPARRILGYERAADNSLVIDNEARFLSRLKVVIFNLLGKKGMDGKRLDSRSLNKDGQIEAYLRAIRAKDVVEVDRRIAAESISEPKKANSPITERKGNREKTTPGELPFSLPPHSSGEVSIADSAKVLRYLSRRFHHFVRQIAIRHASRPTLLIKDEYDVQDAFIALLKLFFDDVRAEEPGPSHAGASSRMDMFIKAGVFGIEIKKTRAGLSNARQVGDELILDVARYQQHAGCKRLFCFVYDPEGKIINPSSIEADLASASAQTDFPVEVVINQSS